MYGPEFGFQNVLIQNARDEQAAEEKAKEQERKKQRDLEITTSKDMKNTLLAGSSALSWLSLSPSESTAASASKPKASVPNSTSVASTRPSSPAES
ncbi:hypothetical protein E2P81_ATG09629 [Venturia nashicola]|uniref:Uncharacterized protein n=1 Tax=Venturia nashicola TaxID=86259 RepID=A0A4Z1NRU2_9PEZI|nr:hypothetical protein E6O75_ATG09840 [Venturia nashicola]TLD25972.1 hypothetical protein E2P81_ATG09629 [Venturia nashicola]